MSEYKITIHGYESGLTKPAVEAMMKEMHPESGVEVEQVE